MKKICILQNDLAFGGTDAFVINLCKGLTKDGYDVTVVLSIDRSITRDREEELTSIGVKIAKTCSLSGLSSKLKHLRMLYKILKKGKYDVFQTNIDLFNGPQMLVSWLARIPIRECHSHNSQQGRELSQGRTLPVRIYQKVMRWMCWKFANRHCGCSEYAMDFLFENKWKGSKTARIIHNGIELSEYCKRFDCNKKKEELGLTNKYQICTIGRISFQKNPEFLLDVFYEVTKIRDDIDLVWCGKGELQDTIDTKISNYGIGGRVHLLGTRSDIPEILQCSDLFFLPSRFEGLGIVLIEAQAANLPCVVSDVIPEEADVGLCYPLNLSQDAKTWAKEICSFLDKERHLEVNNAQLYKFSIENMVKEMEEVFEI